MDNIFTEVFEFYMKVFAVLVTYFAVKFYSQHYEFKKMSLLKKLWHYTKPILVIAVIASFASNDFKGGEDDDDPVYVTKQHPQRGIIVFVVLLIPLLIGIEEGKHGNRENYKSYPDNSGDYE